MSPRDVLAGRAYVLGDNVDTDQIIPAHHLTWNPAVPEECRTRPWGLDIVSDWQVGRIPLGDDWSVLCYTDGIIDTVIRPQQQFGARRVAVALNVRPPGTVKAAGAETLTPRPESIRFSETLQTPAPPPASVSATRRRAVRPRLR